MLGKFSAIQMREVHGINDLTRKMSRIAEVGLASQFARSDFSSLSGLGSPIGEEKSLKTACLCLHIAKFLAILAAAGDGLALD